MEKKKSFVLKGALWVVGIHIVVSTVLIFLSRIPACSAGKCDFFAILTPIFFAGSMVAWGIGGDNYTSFSFQVASWIYSIIIALLIGALIGFLYSRHYNKKHGKEN